MRCVGQGGPLGALIGKRELDKAKLEKEIKDLEAELLKPHTDKELKRYEKFIKDKKSELKELNAEIKQLYEQNAGPSASVSLCSARRTVSGPPAPRRRHSLALGCSCSMCMPSCLLTRCVALSCCVCGGAPSIAPVGAGLAGGGGAAGAGAGAGAGGAAQGWSLVIRLACSAIPPAVSWSFRAAQPRRMCALLLVLKFRLHRCSLFSLLARVVLRWRAVDLNRRVVGMVCAERSQKPEGATALRGVPSAMVAF